MPTITQNLKRLRNDAVQKAFLLRRPSTLQPFLQNTENVRGQNLVLVVAYEQPWTLDWLLRMAARHLTDGVVLICDNSRRASVRMEIERICQERAVPYLALPSNPTRHANRSHGMAMSWIFYNVVRALQPRSFSFIDHDLIPLEDIALEQTLGTQPFYGLANNGPQRWSLWAGYCMYNFAATQHLPLNFLNDFPHGLDTGGCNWPVLYQNHKRAQLRFAPEEQVEVLDRVADCAYPLQVIDQRWLHLSGASYSPEFRSKFAFYERLAQAADAGATLSTLLSQNANYTQPLHAPSAYFTVSDSAPSFETVAASVRQRG